MDIEHNKPYLFTSYSMFSCSSDLAGGKEAKEDAFELGVGSKGVWAWICTAHTHFGLLNKSISSIALNYNLTIVSCYSISKK